MMFISMEKKWKDENYYKTAKYAPDQYNRRLKLLILH